MSLFRRESQSKGEKTVDEFRAEISHETSKARREAPKKVGDQNITSVGCVDRMTAKGAWNPPGGVTFLFNEGYLEAFFERRAGRGGTLFGHIHCGYIFTEMGMEFEDQHERILREIKSEVEKLNEQYHTHFDLVIEGQGSAAPYMTASSGSGDADSSETQWHREGWNSKYY